MKHELPQRKIEILIKN